MISLPVAVTPRSAAPSQRRHHRLKPGLATTAWEKATAALLKQCLPNTLTWMLDSPLTTTTLARPPRTGRDGDSV